MFPDQFSPYRHFGCNLQTAFKGTLFRFPLRTAQTASQSLLKKTAYRTQDIQNLLAAFQSEAEDVVLFLKNVKKVSICMTDSTGAIKTLFQVERKVDDMVQFSLIPRLISEGKSSFLEKLKQMRVPSKSCTTIEVLSKEPSKEGELISSITTWLVASCLGHKSSKDLAIEEANSYLKLIPWGSVAAPLKTSKQNLKSKTSCFLPISLCQSGFPAGIHVNGYFELSSDRRDIWRGDNMTGVGQTRARWNEVLLEDAVATSYANLIVQSSRLLGSCEQYIALFPTSTRHPFDLCVTQLYQNLRNEKVFYTGMNFSD